MDTRFEDKRNKIIGGIIIVVIIICLIIGISLWSVSGSWPTRFKSELNIFFVKVIGKRLIQKQMKA